MLVLATLLMALRRRLPRMAAHSPFRALAGSWSGGGTLSMSERRAGAAALPGGL